MPRTAIIERLPLADACRALGISDDTFRRRWADVFTDYRTDGGHRRVSEDELIEAQAYPDPAKARAAVLRLRRVLGRIG